SFLLFTFLLSTTFSFFNSFSFSTTLLSLLSTSLLSPILPALSSFLPPSFSFSNSLLPSASFCTFHLPLPLFSHSISFSPLFHFHFHHLSSLPSTSSRFPLYPLPLLLPLFLYPHSLFSTLSPSFYSSSNLLFSFYPPPFNTL